MLLLALGIWLEIGSHERAYERGFLVVANNIAEATDSDYRAAPDDITELERTFAIDRQEELGNVSTALGGHAPLVAGLLALARGISLRRKEDEQGTNEDSSIPRLISSACFLLTAASCLMVWGEHEASWPVQSSVVLVDHPTFVGTDFFQWPLVATLAAVGLVSTFIRKGNRWVQSGVAILLVAVGISAFFSVPSSYVDVPLGAVEGSPESVSLSSLEEVASEPVDEPLFTDPDRFSFGPGNSAAGTRRTREPCRRVHGPKSRAEAHENSTVS